MDLRQRPRHGRPRSDDRRSRLRPLHQRREGRARRRLQDPQRSGRRAYSGSKKALIAAIHDALYCSKICSYAQGFQLMRAAQKNISGNSTSGRSPRSGAAAASSARASSRRSPKPISATRTSRTSARSVSSRDECEGAGKLAPRRRPRRRQRRAAPRRSTPPWPTTTATAAPASRQFVARPARLLRRPHLRAQWTNRAASSSTSTGPSQDARKSRREAEVWPDGAPCESINPGRRAAGGC
jgi:hypothetical protein